MCKGNKSEQIPGGNEWAQVPGGNISSALAKQKMGTYIYLSCKTCNEYIHIGKTTGSDFEVSYDKLKRFLIRHTTYNGCILVTLNDSVSNFEYNFCMQGDEFE